MEAKKANLFIVGAMKAGTTSFIELLSQHPAIFVSPIKEPHYFVDTLPKQFLETSRFFSLENYFKNQYPAPRHSVQVSKEEHYQQLFSNAKDEQYSADASTSYLHAPEAPSRIYNYNPQAKIIILTRNPLKRAFSHYNMDLGVGRERKSFAAVMARDLNLYKKGTLPWYSYLNMSCYNEPIRQYHNIFESVLVLSLEDLVSNTEREMGKVANFLDIAAFPDLLLKKVNEGHALKYQKLFYFLKAIGLKDWFSQFLSNDFKGKILKRIREKKPIFALPQDLVDELETIFKKN
ncbi:MAG: sulfotransferase [bacterium]|nr:sulfotransferase [bacterium]